jgi:hypothetical protein
LSVHDDISSRVARLQRSFPTEIVTLSLLAYNLMRVRRLVAFRRLLEKAAELPELPAWLAQAAPEQCVPTLWDAEPSAPPAPHVLAMYRLLLIQVRTASARSPYWHAYWYRPLPIPVRSTARHAIHLQFDISSNVIEIRAVQSPKCMACC